MQSIINDDGSCFVYGRGYSRPIIAEGETYGIAVSNYRQMFHEQFVQEQIETARAMMASGEYQERQGGYYDT